MNGIVHNCIHHLCLILSATTRKLVDQYEQQCQHFMASTTVSQFKKLFPASATPYKLMSAEKITIKLKLSNLWRGNTLEDLNNLIIILGVPLHVFDITHGCITVLFLCLIADVKELKINVNSSEVADLLRTKGVLQVFIGEELMLECSQPESAAGNLLVRVCACVHDCVRAYMYVCACICVFCL